MRILKILRVNFYAIRALCHVSNGRWFVLRNSPDEVVEALAALDVNRAGNSPEVQQLVSEASEEKILRARKLKTR